jgi:hypothetical protein
VAICPFLLALKCYLLVLSEGLKLAEILKDWQGYPNFEKDVWRRCDNTRAKARGVAQRVAIEDQKSNDMKESEPSLQ